MSSKEFFAPDCARCAGLCCVAPAFDKGEDFAIDKAARLPCPNLDRNFACAIHDDLAQKGFRGCVSFDCLGAGQRVVQEVFDGRNWRDNPEISGSMFDCFAVMRRVHGLLQLLSTARGLRLSDAQRTRLAALEKALGARESWSVDDVLAFDLAEATRAVHEFLASLQSLVGQRGPL